MIEVVAAVAAAVISVAAVAVGNFNKRSNEGREAVIRLTESVNTVAVRLDELHTDLKQDSREIFKRLSGCEQRLIRLETGYGVYKRRSSDISESPES